MKTIHVGNLTIDGSKLFLIAGPCVIEGYDRTLMIGREIKKICERLGVQYIFKASFDKANRSSYHSFRGPGLEKGLEILADIKKELQVPVLSDVHDVTQSHQPPRCSTCSRSRPSSAARLIWYTAQRRQASLSM